MSAAEAPGRPALRERLRAGWMRLRGGTLSPGRAATSIGVGLFVGCSPFYGIHSLLVLAVCVPLRLDAAIAYFAAHVSNPITGPLLFGLEIEVGSLILTGKVTKLTLDAARQAGLMSVGGRLFLGWLIVGTIASLLGAATTWGLTLRVRDLREPGRAKARKRTLTRYEAAPRSVYWYVRAKLGTDPALDAIAALPGSFGRIVDAGSGFGHVGLGLLDEARGTTLLGVDVDPARVAMATAAAGDSASFVCSDIRTFPFPECDTILFTDSLHYLSPGDQRGVLEHAAKALSPGGRLVIREVRAGASVRSKLTEWLERRAARRRGQTKLAFQGTEDLGAMLSALGLAPSVIQHEQWSVLDNVLVVGRKPEGGSR